MSDIYGIVMMIPEQQFICDRHCTGKTCGKLIFGGIDTDSAGPLLVCRTPKDECPCLHSQMDEPMGDVDGEPVFIRRLQEPKEARDE